MEDQYRNMMDEVRAPEGLRQEVMNINGQERTKKTRPTPMRALLVAACVCALLVVGAVAAAEMFGVQVSPVLPGDELPLDPSEDPEDYSGYTVINDGGFSWDRVSEELQAEAKANMQDCIYIAYFGSQAELEAALGFALPYNPVLDAAQEIEGRYKPSKSEEWIDAFGELMLFGTDEMLDRLHLTTKYMISNPEHVEHDAPSRLACTGEVTVAVQYSGRESGTTTVTHVYEGFNLTREEYVTPNGLQAVIIQEDSYMYKGLDGSYEVEKTGYQSYSAYLSVDGMVLKVYVHGNETCTDVKGILISILDAYQ